MKLLLVWDCTDNMKLYYNLETVRLRRDYQSYRTVLFRRDRTVNELLIVRDCTVQVRLYCLHGTTNSTGLYCSGETVLLAWNY